MRQDNCLVTDAVPVKLSIQIKNLVVDAGKGVKKERLTKEGAAVTNYIRQGAFFARPGVAKALKDTSIFKKLLVC